MGDKLALLARLPDYEKEYLKVVDFLQNFEDYSETRIYLQQLQEIANRQRKVLEVSLDDVLRKTYPDEELANNIQTNTQHYVCLFERAVDSLLPKSTEAPEMPDLFDILSDHRLKELERSAERSDQSAQDSQAPPPPPVELDLPKSLLRRYEVSILPPADLPPRKIREIRAADIGSLVVVSGMVTRVSDVKPQVRVVTYACEVCGSEMFQEVSGAQFMPLFACASQRCRDDKTKGNLQMLSRGSKFVKYQELKIQELPHQVPVGHIPRGMVLHCRGESTRSCSPGDVVTVSGIFLALRAEGYRALHSGLQADTYVEAMRVERAKQSYSSMELVESAQRLIQEIAQDHDPYGRLARSIAPEIFGHEDVKKALLLQLVGGVTKSLPDGMKIRGDINVLLMGDPGVAKSQLLKYIASVAPRGVYTTGKGSSGVGLTASVVRDNVTGDMALEGGALVMADRGVCCIDEFDKMEDADRTAIHEVMEQQTVSIAKAGITTTLNARAAVLAAANPLYGRYNLKKSVSENVDLPNSLLSRFDLLFLMLDKASLETDLALSRHVLHVHRYRKNPNPEAAPLDPAAVKQYIAAARSLEPSIPKQLSAYLVEAYVSLRAQDGAGPAATRQQGAHSNDQAAMTARQLLSILRLSQALARLRLVGEVEVGDADEAIRLIHMSKASLFDDSPGKPREDFLSAIFSALRDLSTQQNSPSVNYSFALAMVLRRGFTEQQLLDCVEEYESLGVMAFNEDKTRIEML